MIRRQTHRWDAGLVAALALVGFGLLFAEPALVTAALVPLAYVVYAAVSGLESVSLAATRTLDAAGAAPGDAVRVELTVTNTGETVLPDLRVVDGVPGELTVTAGSPRAALALQPGERATLSYTVVARRGAYQFDQPLVEAYSLAGSEAVATELEAAGDESLLCAQPLRDPPPEEATTPQSGTVPTDTGGSGLEFFATRQYSPGDPMNRIDWRHVAKTGEFVTVQYRREQASRTVIIVDCRQVARVTAKPGYPTAVSLCAYAAERFQGTLEQAGVDTSVVVVGLDRDVAEGLVDAEGIAWVDTDAQTGATVEALFRGAQQVANRKPLPLSLVAPTPTWDRQATQSGTHQQVAQADGGPGVADPEGAADPGGAADGSTNGTTSEMAGASPPSTERLVSRLSADAEVILCTPLVDNWPVELAGELAVRDHAPTVVSPNVTAGVTPGKRIGSIHRRLRIRTLRRAGVGIVDWELGQSIDHISVALESNGGNR